MMRLFVVLLNAATLVVFGDLTMRLFVVLLDAATLVIFGFRSVCANFYVFNQDARDIFFVRAYDFYFFFVFELRYPSCEDIGFARRFADCQFRS